MSEPRMSHEGRQDGLDNYLRSLLAGIDRHGWMIQSVFPTEASSGYSFSYTVGLTPHGHPELLLVAIAPQIAGHWLNHLAAIVVNGKHTFTDGETVEHSALWTGDLLIRGPVDDTDYPANMARQLWGEVDVLQVTFADKAGVYWHDGGDPRQCPPSLPLKEG